MDEDKLKELKSQTAVDNSRLEEMLKKGITAEIQIEFTEELKKSQLYLPVSFSQNMFEGLEDAKPGDVFETTGREGFDINYLTDADGNRAVPLFTSDEAMKEANLPSSVMVMFVSDLVDMLKQSERYAAVAINPFTDYGISMAMEAFVKLFDEPTQEEKEFFDSLNRIVELLKNHSYELEEDMAFMIGGDVNFMRENAVDGVFVPNIPFDISTDPDYCKDMKYKNILLFEKGRKVLPLGRAPKGKPDTLVAPGTEFGLEKELDESTTVWKCGAQPFYD